MTGKAPEPGRQGIEDIVDELLAIPPQRFTEARNAAAKQARAGGRREAADEIKRLPRPSIALWALNRLAHEQPSLIESFLSAADRLRQAHRGGGDIRAAMLPARDAEGGVVAAAGKLARAQGMNVTETVMRALRETLSAATANPEVATALRDGRLLREPEAPSLEAILASLPQASAAARKKEPRRRDRESEALPLRAEIADAKAAASRARDEARTASDSATAAHREWERAQKLAERARRASDAAEERLTDLRERLGEVTSRSSNL
jgi:hypothetical protein